MIPRHSASVITCAIATTALRVLHHHVRTTGSAHSVQQFLSSPHTVWLSVLQPTEVRCLVCAVCLARRLSCSAGKAKPLKKPKAAEKELSEEDVGQTH